MTLSAHRCWHADDRNLGRLRQLQRRAGICMPVPVPPALPIQKHPRGPVLRGASMQVGSIPCCEDASTQAPPLASSMARGRQAETPLPAALHHISEMTTRHGACDDRGRDPALLQSQCLRRRAAWALRAVAASEAVRGASQAVLRLPYARRSRRRLEVT
jgi:hypothetical protein